MKLGNNFTRVLSKSILIISRAFRRGKLLGFGQNAKKRKKKRKKKEKFLTSILKESTVEHCLIIIGKSFQSFGAMTEKDMSP